MRIVVAGLAFVRREKRSATGPVVLPTDGEPFGHNSWNHPDVRVPQAKDFVSQMGIVRAITLLEDFCVGVQAEKSRCNSITGIASPEAEKVEDDGEGFCPKDLYERMGWSQNGIKFTDPLYEYFSELRNCVVHRSGRANTLLVKRAASTRLESCIENWPSRRRLPTLPVVRLNERVPVLPRHAMLAAEVCRRIAIDANQKLLSELGMKGVVYMAAYHSLLSKRPLKTNAKFSAQAVLNTIITGRYRVRLDDPTEAVQVLSELGRWKAYLRKYQSSIAT